MGTKSFAEVNGGATARNTGLTNNDGILGILSADGVTMNFLDEMGATGNDRLFDVEVYGDYIYYTGAVATGFPASATGVFDATYNGGATDALIGRYRTDGTQYKATFYGTNNTDLANALKQVTPTTCTADESTTFLLVWGTVTGTVGSTALPTVNLNSEPFFDNTHNGGTDMFLQDLPKIWMY